MFWSQSLGSNVDLPLNSCLTLLFNDQCYSFLIYKMEVIIISTKIHTCKWLEQ